jgi:HprK-related kinase A
LYSDFTVCDKDVFVDFAIAMSSGNLLARLRGQADFLFENQSYFASIPYGQAYAFLEWGMNWCVSIHANEYLKLHSAVVAKEGIAILLPGIPGAGKSTLCAALGLRGWRILSDEHALIPPGTSHVAPLCRPVSLKNESIALIESFDSGAVMGPLSKDTHKGVVAHMKADIQPDSHDLSPLTARFMIFPKYSTDSTQELSPRGKTDSFVLAAYHSFNYSVLGEAGFDAMRDLVASVDCYDLVYHDLDWAISTLEQLHRDVAAA